MTSVRVIIFNMLRYRLALDNKVNQHALTDIRKVYIYENQRWNPVTGYTNK